uniref:Uncharacterized protein n=1 Tax=Steinernema glaseri TaxID=37863 RepID=A0A1I7ZPA3_9BILA
MIAASIKSPIGHGGHHVQGGGDGWGGGNLQVCVKTPLSQSMEMRRGSRGVIRVVARTSIARERVNNAEAPL